MFSRVHEDAQGSGLGLYMVQNALKKLNAKVTVESTEGKGTCFHLHFPQQFLD
jgi:signal transduction histidine kinase